VKGCQNNPPPSTTGKVLQILRDCEFLTKGSALRIGLSPSSCYPSKGKDICPCYPMKVREYVINQLYHSNNLFLCKALDQRIVWAHGRRES
jgi:hypothetical protein